MKRADIGAVSALRVALPRKEVADFFSDWETGFDKDKVAEIIATSIERYCKRDTIELLVDAFHDFLNHFTIKLEPVHAEDGSFDGFDIIVYGGSGTIAEWTFVDKEVSLKALVANMFRDDTQELFLDEERGHFNPARRQRVVAAWLRAWANELDGGVS
jgi:hypothetical protein